MLTDNLVVISALGSSNYDTVKNLTQSVSNCGGNILSTRMTTMGHEFGMMLMVSGSWSTIAKIETMLPQLESKLGLHTIIRRTFQRDPSTESIPYTVTAVALDREGILSKVANFFHNQAIAIEDVNAQTFTANSGAKMVNLNVQVNIPSSVHLPTLRERFMAHCDEHNLDAGLEPTIA